MLFKTDLEEQRTTRSFIHEGFQWHYTSFQKSDSEKTDKKLCAFYNEVLILFWKRQLTGTDNTAKVKLSALQPVEFLNVIFFFFLFPLFGSSQQAYT